jgi:hypothetical protein
MPIELYQEPRIWFNPVYILPDDGRKVYVRLFASPFIPIKTGYDDSSQTFITVTSSITFNVWEISEWSYEYYFP